MSKTNAHGALCINSVFQYLLLIFRNVFMHIGITHLYYVIKFLSSAIYCHVVSTKIQLLSVLVCDNRFHFIDFYLKSLEDTQGFSGSQRFCNLAKRLERNCKLCLAFSHSHKTHQSRQHSRELNLLIRC